MTESTSTVPAVKLKSRLLGVRHHQKTSDEQVIRVPGIGQGISTVYEQFRNAAEYNEEHLLLQRATRRFLNRNLSFHSQRNVGDIGNELIIELTQAGYLPNSSVKNETANTIQTLVVKYMNVYRDLRKERVPAEVAVSWVLDILSVNSAWLLDPHNERVVFAYFAYEHYLKLFPKEAFITDPSEVKLYEISLYVAAQRALLKSDLATVRSDLINLYQKGPEDLEDFIEFNQDITTIFLSPLTQKLRRAINKYGAPLRILKRLIEDHPELPDALDNRSVFLALYEKQTYKEYKSVARRLNKGLIKSIVFLLITKAVIGVSVEIPYDLITVGSVAFMPLGINLLFPPLYMAGLKFGLRPPSHQNAQALIAYIDKALFTHEQPIKPALKAMTQSISAVSKFVYTLAFFIPFAITVFVLTLLHFNIVQTIIFFVFLSTASFLGFRLSQIIRELEIVTKDLGLIQAARDFFYLPFIVVGQWLSNKYAKINLIGAILDLLIELPLKTVLRLLRQWLRFINDRREQIY
jgi:hypothetical protein